eukprot:PhF_6_TR8309/c0_g1_i3/m.12855
MHDEVGMVHMDIKPENIILLNHPEEMTSVKLIDFGSAVRCCEGAVTTNTGGTWYYCSPEKLTCRSNGYCPKKADIWALGVTAAVNIFGDHNCPFPTSWTKSRRIFREKLRRLMTTSKTLQQKSTATVYCTSTIHFEDSQENNDIILPTVMRDNIPTPPELLDLLRSMMCPDPEVRPTAKTLLDHAFFKT